MPNIEETTVFAGLSAHVVGFSGILKSSPRTEPFTMQHVGFFHRAKGIDPHCSVKNHSGI